MYLKDCSLINLLYVYRQLKFILLYSICINFGEPQFFNCGFTFLQYFGSTPTRASSWVYST